MVKRCVNADSASLVTANSYGLTDKNLFSYCDNSPVSRRDDGGELWSELLTGVAVVAGITAVCALAVATAGISVSAVAVAGGGMALSASTTSTSLAALGVAGASMVISAASVYFAKKTKGNSSYDPDPYKRPDQKKQGREGKNKNREKENYKPRNNRRDNKPAKPKHHTPAKEHQKFPQSKNGRRK